MTMKLLALAIMLVLLCGLYVGARAVRKPWESRWVPLVIVGGLVAALVALGMFSGWYGRTYPGQGVDDPYCDGLDCPPEHASDA